MFNKKPHLTWYLLWYSKYTGNISQASLNIQEKKCRKKIMLWNIKHLKKTADDVLKDTSDVLFTYQLCFI